MKRLLYAACLVVVLLPWVASLWLFVLAARRPERETVIPNPPELAPVVRQWEKDQGGGIKVETWYYYAHRNPADDYLRVGVRFPMGDGVHMDCREARLVIRDGKAVETSP